MSKQVSKRTPSVCGEALVERNRVTAGVLPVRNAGRDLPRLLILNGNLVTATLAFVARGGWGEGEFVYMEERGCGNKPMAQG